MAESKNRLAQSASPYLLQHADNPVHWWPWCEEALAEARQRLLEELSGRRHSLITAVVVVRGAEILLAETSAAHLTMRPLSPQFVDHYLETVGEEVCNSVGAYQLEGYGAHLFTGIDGDFFTILGLPLLSVLDVLRHEGAIKG